jgi:hypothetical protein
MHLIRTTLLATAFAAAPAALAQNAANVMLFPYGEGQMGETKHYGILQSEGSMDDVTDQPDIQLYQIKGYLRTRFSREDAAAPGFGAAYHYISIDEDTGILPEDLTDVSVAGRWNTAISDEWDLGFIVGVGSASNEPFDESDGLYGLADLVATWNFREDEAFVFSLNYNGNRVVLPDVPIPGFAYRNQKNQNLTYVLGIPVSSVYWTPTDRLTLNMAYAPTLTFNGKVEYELIDDEVGIFGRINSDVSAFDLADDDSDDRLMFSQRRIEAGVSWQLLRRALRLEIAGGYEFDQEFEFGWDLRDTDTVTEISDEPYVRLTAALRF